MRIIKDCEFDKECLICNTKKKGDGVLIGISGTEKDGNIQAKLFHLECIELLYYEKGEECLIAQRW